MFCKYCGNQIPDTTKFCPKCGKATGITAPPPGDPAAPSGSSAKSSPISGAFSNLGSLAGKAASGITSAAGAPRVKVKKTYNLGNFAYWGGCVLVLISLFLTYASASLLGITQSASLMDTETGTYFLVFIGIAAVLNLLKLNLVSTGWACFIFYMNTLAKQDFDQFGGLIQMGAGYTLMLIGTLLMILAGVTAFVLRMMQKKNARTQALS